MVLRQFCGSNLGTKLCRIPSKIVMQDAAKCLKNELHSISGFNSGLAVHHQRRLGVPDTGWARAPQDVSSRGLLCENKRHFIPRREGIPWLIFPYRCRASFWTFHRRSCELGRCVTSSDGKLERVGFGLILCIALLMFFQPLVRLHGPNGSKVSDVFNVRYELSQLQSNLRVMAATKPSPDGGVSPAAAKPVAMPFSLRMASLVPWFVFAALGLCLLALLDLFFFRRAVTITSFVGGCAGAIALLHVMLMGSDLQSWTEVLMNTELVDSPHDAGLGGAVLMANSFLVSPGFGLYALTTCLFLVPFLSSTRAFPRLRSVVRHERRVHLSQPVHIRPVNSRYPQESCTSLDVSKSGLRLESSSNHYYAGMEVYVTRHAGAGNPADPEEHGSVVRVERVQSGGCRIAISIIPEA